MSRSNLPSLAAILGVGVLLAGCVSLFPKQPPAQMYRFAYEADSAAPVPPAGTGFDVAHASTIFDQAAASDRILTSSGDQAAYIAGARWVSPAAVLFDEAEAQAFEAVGGSARLIMRGGGAASLQLDVQSFEAVYTGGSSAAPTVVVRVHGRLVRSSDHQVLGDRVFESRKPAADNRVGAIVQAFDAATSEALGQIVAWTNSGGGA